jgi:hypothetical protein
VRPTPPKSRQRSDSGRSSILRRAYGASGLSDNTAMWMGRCEPPADIMRTSGSKSMSRSTTSGVDVRHRARAVERRAVVPTGMVAAAPQAGRSGRRAQP